VIIIIIIIIILVLKPGASLEGLKDALPVHSVRCLGSFCLIPPACISWGFLTVAVLKGERPSLTPNHRMVDQVSVFTFSGDRVVHPHAGHLVSFLVASSDKCGLRWG